MLDESLIAVLRCEVADWNDSDADLVSELVGRDGADETARFILAALRVRALEAAMTDDLGPFYDTRGLIEILGCTRQALFKRRKDHAIVWVPTDAGSILYPAWQFVARGDRLHLVDGIPQVLKVLARVIDDPLSHAIWLTGPSTELGGLTPVDWLRRQRSLQPVLDLAAADNARLTDGRHPAALTPQPSRVIQTTSIRDRHPGAQATSGGKVAGVVVAGGPGKAGGVTQVVGRERQ